MRTQNIKFLRTDDGRLFMFRYGGGSIYARILYKNMPSPSFRVIDNVSDVFSIWYCDGRVYLLCLSDEGATLCLYANEKWTARLLSGRTEDSFSKMSFLSLGDSIHLVYSVNGGLYIRSGRGSRWSVPVKIDEAVPFSETPFYIGRENSRNVRIYYRTSDKDIKYRTLNLESGELSERLDLLSANMPCIDVSVLTEENETHILYLVKGPFSSQLIYKGIKNASSSKARIIWEGQLSGSCSLLKNDGRLYALIYDRTKCFAAFSDDSGHNFSAAKNLGIRTGDSCLKAEYTDFSGQSFCADEIPTDISDFSFPVTEDIFPSFIPRGGDVQNHGPSFNRSPNMMVGNQPSQNSSSMAEMSVMSGISGMAGMPGMAASGANGPSAMNGGSAGNMGNMGNQENMNGFRPSSRNPQTISDGNMSFMDKSPQKPSSDPRIAELSERINELNSLLSKRNDEIAALSSWKMRYDALLKENSSLKARMEKSQASDSSKGQVIPDTSVSAEDMDAAVLKASDVSLNSLEKDCSGDVPFSDDGPSLDNTSDESK